MRRAWTRRAGAIALTITVVGVAAAAAPLPTQAPVVDIEAAAPPAAKEPVRGAVSDHVIVISIDGLRPDAIDRYDASVLKRLIREGAANLEARTIHPSKTLPSHTSMLTGVPPAVHGITWNTDRTSETGTVSATTVFELAKQAGFTTAAFYSKSKLKHLVKPGTLDHAEGPSGLATRMATETVEAVTRYMRHRQPQLVFVHIGEPDFAGHTLGWMTRPYGWAVRRADAAVGRIVEAATAAYGAGNYTVIVTADHGGHARDHGSEHVDDMQIPWIAWGAGVQPGPVTAAVNTVDTAATVAWLLGVAAPPSWVGTPVATAYTASARYAAYAALSVPAGS